MALEYFYITNNQSVALACERAGVDRIFVDMEYIGKDKRQKGLDTVKNHHTVQDVKNIMAVIKKSKLMVRVNPIHSGSVNEINSVIAAGADFIMLPMWKTVEDVKQFLDIVDGRAKTMLLLETEEARLCLDDVLKLSVPNSTGEMVPFSSFTKVEEQLGQHKKFMFELYTDGTVDEIVSKLKKARIKFGIGGVGKVNSNNLLPAENILCEHYRLGSSMAILARAFCDWEKYDIDEFEKIITDGIAENRVFEKEIENKNSSYFDEMHKQTANIIDKIKVNI